MIKGYTYKIFNTVNEKLYVGQTIRTIKERWDQHISSTNNPNDKNYDCGLHNAMRELVIENFHIEQVEKVTAETADELKEKLNEREIY